VEKTEEVNNKKRLSDIREIYKFLKGCKKDFFISTFFMVLRVCSDLIHPIIFGLTIEVIAKRESFDEIIYYSLLMFVVGMIGRVFWIGEYGFRVRYSHSVRRVIRYNLFKKVLALEVKAFDEVRNGELLNRIDNETNKITSLFDGLVSTILYSIRAAFVMLMILKINIYVGLVVFISMIINYYNFEIAGKKLKKIHQENRLNDDSMKSNLQQSLAGIRDVKALGIKENVYKKFEYDHENYLKIDSKAKIVSFIQMFVGTFISRFVRFAGILIGGYFVYVGSLELRYLVAITTYLAYISATVHDIGSFNQKSKDIEVAIERIMYILNNKEYEDETFGNEELDNTNGNIKFENIEFGYDDDSVLNNITLDIKQNELTALVGKSGSGKSTIFSLLLRFYDYRKGKITIDGIEINKFNENSLRENISVIRQEPFLFNVSIKENLLMVKEDATDEEIETVCKKAHIHHYISELKDGYETVVGEGGVNLSGGQKQRLAIARALLKGSKILLFDEATSALDNKAQEIIKNTINELKENHTIVVIAHRLSTIVDADNIIMIDDGKVVAQGKHEELMDKNDIYKELYSLNN
jgi:ATP-binding cassette subfamily B protein